MNNLNNTYKRETEKGPEPALTKFNEKHCFQLFMPCLSEECDKTKFYWRHEKCNSRLYVNVDGDLLCYKLMDPNDKCDDPFFIQNALFKCEDQGHTSKYVQMKDLSDMVAAIANALASIENISFNGGAQERKQFLKNMQKTISNKWVD